MRATFAALCRHVQRRLAGGILRAFVCSAQDQCAHNSHIILGDRDVEWVAVLHETLLLAICIREAIFLEPCEQISLLRLILIPLFLGASPLIFLALAGSSLLPLLSDPLLLSLWACLFLLLFTAALLLLKWLFTLRALQQLALHQSDLLILSRNLRCQESVLVTQTLVLCPLTLRLALRPRRRLFFASLPLVRMLALMLGIRSSALFLSSRGLCFGRCFGLRPGRLDAQFGKVNPDGVRRWVRSGARLA